MKRIVCIALLLLSAGAMAEESEQNCIQKPVDNRSTTVKIFNGITTVLHALDPTIWIARGILVMIPGQHNAPAPKYCEDLEPQASLGDRPGMPDTPSSPESQDSQLSSN